MQTTILQGDSLAMLRTLPDKSVQMCCTSPPYYNLRDYSTAKWIDGDPNCDHQMPRNTTRHRPDDKSATNAGSNPATWKTCGKCGAVRASSSWTGGDPICEHQGDQRYYEEHSISACSSDAFYEAGPANADRLKKARWRERGTCTKCGAVWTDQQIGLEDTPIAYINRLVEVFHEVHRVLRDDGVLFLNIGDSYNNRKKIRKSSHRPGFNSWSDDEPWVDRAEKGGCRLSLDDGDLKEKDLIGIPWMLAFALRADDWYLRSDIIWTKASVMPESVKDRPTRSHEHVFMLTKSKRYFFDADAIAEPSKDPTDDRKSRAKANHKRVPTETIAAIRPGSATYPMRNSRDVWKINTKPFRTQQTVRQVHVQQDAPYNDKKRITSPDCPLHGDHPVLSANASYDEHATESGLGSARIDNHLVREPPNERVPIDLTPLRENEGQSLDSPLPLYSLSAMHHSNQTHKMGRAPATNSPCIASEGMNCRTEHIVVQPASSYFAQHTAENKKRILR